MLRFMGGSDCCRDLLCRLGLTRFVAAYETSSFGRSSLLEVLIFKASAPANPVKALALSDAATRRAFPR